MIYPQDFEHKIDFTPIREQLSQLCSSEMGREKVGELTFLTHPAAIRLLLLQAREMLVILHDNSLDYPKSTIPDVRESVKRIRIEGLFMDEEELLHLRRLLEAADLYTSFFRRLDSQRFPVLCRFADYSLPDECADFAPSQTIAAIDRIIDKYGRLRDNASPALADIRRSLQQAQGSVNRALNSILRQAQAEGMIDPDVMPTLREGRLVIPVSPQYKRKIGGIVHDESATGKTVYIEPQQVVEANNRIRELESEEKRERARILMETSAGIRTYIPAILTLHQFLAEVDFLYAKARFADKTGAIAPELKEQPMIDWREARHPLLQQRLQRQDKKIVPLNLRLNEPNRILVISGPNAGGKSVCLKTAALLQYMLQCGLPIPVREDSTAGIFNSLFIDIGDEQSIENDLSTYSSHLRNMKFFLRNSNAHTLLLIDEFGGGTEPRIGGAIAEAVLKQLNSHRSFGLITTHYDNLKHLAEDTEGIINGAMLYDSQRLQPLFQLSIGQAGSSFAIEIAKQTGLPDDIINEAKQLAGEEHIDYERHLQNIARDKHYWEQKRKQVHEQEKQLEQRIAYYEEQIGSAKQKRREILNEAQEKAEELLRRSNATIENTIRQIKESGADREQTQAARKSLEQFKEKNLTRTRSINRSSDLKQPKTNANNRKNTSTNAQNVSANATITSPALQVGSRIRKRGTTLVGEVVEITDKQAVVAFGSIRSYIPLKQIEHVSAKQAKEERKQQSRVVVPGNVSESIRKKQLTFKGELDLRGMRADEALSALISYIDDAVMVGTAEVRILHGTGTGALRQVVRDYLQMQHRVKHYHDAHPDQGGAGITIVELLE